MIQSCLGITYYRSGFAYPTPGGSFTIPAYLRRQRQLFCRTLLRHGICTYKGKYVTIVFKEYNSHPWRYKVDRPRGLPYYSIYDRDVIYQVLTPKEVGVIMEKDRDLKFYTTLHWLETQHGN